MYLKLFIKDFSKLGIILSTKQDLFVENPLINEVFMLAEKDNPFFTKFMQIKAIEAICDNFLQEEKLNNWLSKYKRSVIKRDKAIGIIMAGNLPMVGFHDLLCVLAAGFSATVKLSSKDKVLLPEIVKILIKINNFWADRIHFVPEINSNIHKIIATGSDDSADFFNNIYKEKERLIRGSRSSIAILRGDESLDQFNELAKDIFLYFGMGCRSVSTILLPYGYRTDRLCNALEQYRNIVNIEDYKASYTYHKAIMEMNGDTFVDGGFYLLANFSALPPPIACINVVYYHSEEDILNFINQNKEHLQVVVGQSAPVGQINLGGAQSPKLDDYADDKNILEFLFQ